MITGALWTPPPLQPLPSWFYCSWALWAQHKQNNEKHIRLKHSVCPSSTKKWAPPGCFIGTELLNRLIMQGYYRWELRKFHSVGRGSSCLSHSLSLPGSASRLGCVSFIFLPPCLSCLLSFALCFFLSLSFSPLHCLCFFSHPLPPYFDLLVFPGLCHFLFHTPIHLACFLGFGLTPFLHILPIFLSFSLSVCCFPVALRLRLFISLPPAVYSALVGFFSSWSFHFTDFSSCSYLSCLPSRSLFSLCLFFFFFALPCLLLPLFLPSVSSEQPSPRLLQSSAQDKALSAAFLLHTHRLSTKSKCLV